MRALQSNAYFSPRTAANRERKLGRQIVESNNIHRSDVTAGRWDNLLWLNNQHVESAATQ